MEFKSGIVSKIIIEPFKIYDHKWESRVEVSFKGDMTITGTEEHVKKYRVGFYFAEPGDEYQMGE